MDRNLTDAIAESRQTNSSVTVEVADVEAARLELLASDYEISEERYATLDGVPVTQVYGWVEGAKDGEEADWSLRLVAH